MEEDRRAVLRPDIGAVRPPAQPTAVEMAPSIWRKAASTPQKQPAPNVAFSMMALFRLWKIHRDVIASDP
jgi:hypothetical protein